MRIVPDRRSADLLALRARASNGQTGVRVVLGSHEVKDAAPASGLIATGRAGTLDAMEWVALAKGSGEGGSLPLRHIDVLAPQLKHLTDAQSAPCTQRCDDAT